MCDDDFQPFYLEPYELQWRPRDAQDVVCVHGKLYNLPAFIKAHDQLQSAPKEPGCDLPQIVVGLMFASDATHLTSFSDAKIWPLYLFFGNKSKYHRGKPTLHLCNHVVYLQKVSNGHIARSDNSISSVIFSFSFWMASRTLLPLVLEEKALAQHSGHTAAENYCRHSGK